jgi:hypothetical protein
MDSGKFSNSRSGSSGEELSLNDRIRMYEEAYALHRSNPEKSRMEVAKLDKMFTK